MLEKDKNIVVSDIFQKEPIETGYKVYDIGSRMSMVEAGLWY